MKSTQLQHHCLLKELKKHLVIAIIAEALIMHGAKTE